MQWLYSWSDYHLVRYIYTGRRISVYILRYRRNMSCIHFRSMSDESFLLLTTTVEVEKLFLLSEIKKSSFSTG